MNIPNSVHDKQQIANSHDVYTIIQRILLRENEIDQEKEHFWVIGMNMAGYILYLELVSLGSVKETVVDPMNVYRVAVMKNATRVIAVHNHPSGSLIPSEGDKDITDRLIQVGRILDIRFEDHLIITPEDYISFRGLGLMTELEQSIKYVPTYQLIDRVRKEEQAIARTKINNVKKAIKAAREQCEKSEQEKEKILLSTINFLLTKQLTDEEIVNILHITKKELEQILKKSVIN